MRVCILASTFPTVSETFVIQHATSLIDNGVDVAVVANHGISNAWESTGNHRSALERRVHHYAMPLPKLRRFVKSMGIAWRHLRNGHFHFLRVYNIVKFGRHAASLQLSFVYDAMYSLWGAVDILHCHFGPAGVLGGKLKELGVARKLVVTFHGYDVSVLASGLHTRVTREYQTLFTIADLLLPISENWRRRLIAIGAPPVKTKTFHLGIDINEFHIRSAESKSHEICILTVARFTEKKGIEYALEALALLKSERPDIRFRYNLVGNGERWNVVKELIDSLHLRDEVVLWGALPHGKIRFLLGNCDIFMLPSITAINGDQEGIPVSLMEAMASGLPVLTTRHSGIPELVIDEVSGFLVDERDSRALTERLIFLATNRDSWPGLSANARATVEREFNVATQTQELLRMYSDLI